MLERKEELIETANELSLPDHPFIQRRISRAYDIVRKEKIKNIAEGLFIVDSQYEEHKKYIVNLNHEEEYCSCPDNRRTIYCKHSIACKLWVQEQLALMDNQLAALRGRC